MRKVIKQLSCNQFLSVLLQPNCFVVVDIFIAFTSVKYYLVLLTFVHTIKRRKQQIAPNEWT